MDSRQARRTLLVVVVSLAIGVFETWCIAGSPAARIIHGEVVDADGRPIENATVYCQSGRYLGEKVCDTTRSGEDGSFAVADLPSPWRPRLRGPSSSGSLWAWAPGYSVAWQEHTEALDARVRLVLSPPQDVHVRVTAPNGFPVPKAAVSIVAIGTMFGRNNEIPSGNCWAPDALVAHTATVTDEKGNATLSAWRLEDGLMISVSAPGYGCQMFPSLHHRKEHEDIVVQLQPVGHLRGRVVSDGKISVGGLTVRVESHSRWTTFYTNAISTKKEKGMAPIDIGLPPMFSVTTVKTDATGRFDVPAAVYGWVDFSIPELDNKPYQLTRTYFKLLDEFRRGDTTEFVLKLEPAVHVHGRLRLFNTKMLPSDFDMICDWGLGEVFNVLPVAADGRFDCYLRPGLASLRPSPCDGTEAFGSGDSFVVPREVKKYDRPAIEVVELRGRVVNTAGKPVANADYFGSLKHISSFCNTGRGKSDSAGYFRFFAYAGRGRFISHDHTTVGDGFENPWEDMSFEFLIQKFGEYEDCKCEWQLEGFRNGIIPDIVLHRERMAQEGDNGQK
jgi:hypothetical protein